jgi:hypothetical protein
LRGSIRKTDFTWDPERQSRQEIWKYLKKHVEAELDRIEVVSKEQVRRRRLIESSHYHRDRSIRHEHEINGVDVATLARKHGVSTVRIREIIRMARHRERIIQLRPRLPQPPFAELPDRGLPELPKEIPQTGAMMKNP